VGSYRNGFTGHEVKTWELQRQGGFRDRIRSGHRCSDSLPPAPAGDQSRGARSEIRIDQELSLKARARPLRWDSAASSGQLEVDFAGDQIDDGHEIAQ
jgi:hypothetical protein